MIMSCWASNVSNLGRRTVEPTESFAKANMIDWASLADGYSSECCHTILQSVQHAAALASCF